MRAMNKKAMIGEQINWVYVMIAGTLIVIFFVGIIYKQKQAADSEFAQETLKRIDEMVGQPPKSSQAIPFPQLEIDTKCNDGVIDISTKNAKTSKRATDPIFSSSKIKSNELITKSDEWNVPFKASNLIFLTSKDTKYIIYRVEQKKSIDLAEKIFNSIPEQAVKIKAKKGETIKDPNVRRVVLIGAEIEPDIPEWAKTYTAVKIVLSDPKRKGQEISGTASYCKVITCTDTTSFFGEPMMLGAIYSDSKKEFECRSKLGYQRMSAVANIYTLRAIKLKTESESSSTILSEVCEGKYRISAINKLKGLDKADEIREIEHEIWEQNEETLHLSCPTIY